MVPGRGADLRRDGVDLSRRLFVVFNPASGRGRGAQIRQQYVDLLRRAGVEFEHESTARSGDEQRLTREAIDAGFDGIVATGGDGTWSHVADAVLQSDRRDELVFGVLPAGTGNDFGRNLGLDPRGLDRAVAALVGGRVRAVDAGIVRTDAKHAAPGQPASGPARSRYFLNVVGLGFDVAVVDAAAGARFLKGELLYKSTAIQQLWRFPGLEVGVEGAGDASPRRHLMVTISNGPVFGGGFPIAPAARVDDGLLHACLIRDASMLGRARLFGAAGSGRHSGMEGVDERQATEFTLHGSSPVRFEVDGDVYEADGSVVQVGILPGVLKVLAH
jgi:diacylglycerol kinase (ATP)